MSIGILVLSPELQLRIVDFILEQDDVKEEEEKGDEQMDSTEHLVPSNLKTLINLSETCSTFRKLLAPYVYKKLYLTNTETSATSVKAVADGPFHDLVTDLLFVGRALGLEELGADCIETIFPKELEHILNHLDNLFPHLNSLNAGFAYDFNEYHTWDIWAQETFYDVETDEEVLEQEEKFAFRTLIPIVWTAISSNTCVKHLKMRHFIPKMSPVYNSDLFHSFLSGVEIFEISIWGCDNGVGWVNSVGDGYLDVLSRLDCIFSSLRSCTDFTIEASQYGWYGLSGWHHASHPFYAGQMPLLRRLTLRHCFISPELKMFLEDHRDTLEEVSLHDCAASTNTFSGLAENGIEWRELFDAMLCIKTLKKVEILPFLEPDSSWVSSDQDTSSLEDKEESEIRNDPASRDQNRTVFVYSACKSAFPFR